MKNLKKKTLIFCFAMTCSALANATDTGCHELTIDNFQDIIKQKQHSVLANPFDKTSCFPVSFKAHDSAKLDASHFGGKENVFGVYKAFLEGENMSVSVVRDPSDGQLYKFMKFVADDDIAKQMKRFFETRKLIHMYSDEFLFLHEVMHLDDITQSKSVTRQEKESISDVAAVFVIGAKHNLSLSDVEVLLKDVQVYRERSLKGQFKDSFGNKIKDDEHYGKESRAVFNKAFDYLDNLKKQSKPLAVSSINEARDLTHSIALS